MHFPKINTLSATVQERLNFYSSYLMISGKMDHIGDAVFDMLNFNDGKLQVFDGLLLRPIRVGSGGAE